MKDIKTTQSICPECLKALDATIFEDEGKVFIKKTCPEHGEYTELYWSDYDQYVRAENFRYEGTAWKTPAQKRSWAAPQTAACAPNTTPTRL
jgi:7,8-dihydro-6-hydroxymethylpterin dimethyltransferase